MLFCALTRLTKHLKSVETVHSATGSNRWLSRWEHPSEEVVLIGEQLYNSEEKKIYTYKIKYYSARKRNDDICSHIEIIIQSEVSQKDKDKCHVISLVCVT